jgi:hypothetical protein
VARRIRDVRHADFRSFTKGLQIAKRELRELEPEAGPRETSIIANDLESAIVGKYLLARARDAKAGGTTTHIEAFMRDRQAVRVLRRMMARIPSEVRAAVDA